MCVCVCVCVLVAEKWEFNGRLGELRLCATRGGMVGMPGNLFGKFMGVKVSVYALENSLWRKWVRYEFMEED